ncbi:DUF3570 domain-containing protein [Marinigracilibium pacificum]|uniref:DUF3570 domain-containing protein n=1 Tax=Marinigracilibium pacificum TaxID=2729599 RepID=A0A848IWK2_9BACT|nr:DUF3570 domain-containing protein [Marinigracilibium pacificum]NMM47655.1 DUF3570 domain-containing protein [Marinigracilibium pacificum]
MRKKYLLIGTLAFFNYWTKAQTQKDSTNTENINKTEIEVVYNHYTQDGNNSAVTGGVGTEKLTVYGPSAMIKKTKKNHEIGIKAGADIITSASTDKIDFVASSASLNDFRSYVNVNYVRNFENKVAVSIGTGASLESDYLSLQFQAGVSKSSKDGLRNGNINVQYLNDDLRWRKRVGNFYKPTTLIYPKELRDTAWFDIYRRHSINFRMGLDQVVNKRVVLGIYPEISYQSGLLSTPFHRVYLTDNSVVVERLPTKRIKEALAIKLNAFLGGKTITKNTIDLYNDNFGITAFAFENETIIKISPFISILGNIRLYHQSGSRYFAPYAIHSGEEEFYTSDYDLSKFNTFGAGTGLKLRTNKVSIDKKKFTTYTFRYYYFHRSTNLRSHSISLIFNTEIDKMSIKK